LGYDDGADDVDSVSLLQVGHGRTQEVIRRAQDRVVDHDSRRALVAVQLSYSDAQILGAARVRLDCVDLGTSVSQAPRELSVWSTWKYTREAQAERQPYDFVHSAEAQIMAIRPMPGRPAGS